MGSFLKTFVILFVCHLGLAQGSFINDSLDTYINREMARWNLPGLAIAVVKDGKVVAMKGYGYADVNNKIPVTENTEFQIASNTKAFTGTALALLEYYGKLKLNDKAKKHLPYFKMKDNYLTEHVTIRDLLSHRIGYGTFQTDLLNWASTRSRKELISNMANVTPKFGFRETYGYCNVGFLAAGEVIPVVCDTTWDDYLKYHFFNPLGMTRTGTTYQNFITSPNASKAYTLLNGSVYEITPSKVDNLGPAGSMTSCVKDLSKWLIMQLDNGKYNGKQIVPRQVLQETRNSNTIVGNSRGKGNYFNTYGLGWFLKDKFGKKIVTHDGGANGFLSKTVMIPEDNFGYVILTNSDAQYLFEAIDAQIINDLMKQPYVNSSAVFYEGFKEEQNVIDVATKKLKAEVLAYKAPADAYKKIAGVYSNKVYGKITIDAKDDCAEVRFEFHPQYKGKIQFKSLSAMMIEYNDESSLGTHEINLYNKNGQQTIEIKVNEFVDMDTYLFTKL